MSQSSLVTRQWWANESNYTKGRTDTIHGIIIHHAASTSLDSVGQAFSQWGRNGSAHYGVCGPQIHQYVREEDTAWHCGDWPGNCCTIGIEVVNSTGAPTWLVSEESFETLAKLCADIAKRNGLGRVKFGPNDVYPTLSAHRDWSATYCVPVEETELLTKDGWKFLKDIEVGEEVASVLLDGRKIKFSKVLAKVPEKTQDTWEIRGVEVTADHRMLWRTQRGEFTRVDAYEDLPNNQAVYIPSAGFYDGKGLPLSDNEIKLLIAVQADGHYEHGEKSAKDRVTFHISKDRKIELLDEILAPYSVKKYQHADGTVSYNVAGIKELCEEWLDDKQFDFRWLELSPEQAKIFLDTILEFDGCKAGNDYSSYKKQNIDVVDAIAAINGIGVRHNGDCRTAFTKDYRSLDKRAGAVRHTGKTVSCVTVESGFILIRQHGRTTVVGNCPGDYLYSRMNELADRINEINYPSKPRLKYTKFDKVVTYITTRNTHLYDFGHSKASDLVQIKSYAKGDKIDIYAKCENSSIGKTFLVTEYSYTKGLTNGFKEDAMEVYKEPEPAPAPAPEPEPEPTPEPEPEPSGDGDSDNPRGMSDEDYEKFLNEIEEIQKKAEEEKAMIPMSNKTYDILKIVAIVILPLIQALYVGLSKIWGFGFGTEIDQTIQLIIAAINTILGVALVKSSSDYHKDE